MRVRRLSVLNYASGFTLWVYQAHQSEALPDVLAADFFNDAGDMLAAGDMVMVSSLDGGRVLIVMATEPSVVVQVVTP